MAKRLLPQKAKTTSKKRQVRKKRISYILNIVEVYAHKLLTALQPVILLSSAIKEYILVVQTELLYILCGGGHYYKNCFKTQYSATICWDVK
jgi:hypothetical protein